MVGLCFCLSLAPQEGEILFHVSCWEETGAIEVNSDLELGGTRSDENSAARQSGICIQPQNPRDRQGGARDRVSHCLPPVVPEFYSEAATWVKSGFLAVPQKRLSGKPM